MSKPDILKLITVRETGQPAPSSMIREALYGPSADSNKAPDREEEVLYDLANPQGPTPDIRSFAQDGPSRRTQRLHSNQGGRSPQGNGHGHKRTFLGRR